MEFSSYLFPENRLRLTPVAALLSVVSPLTCTCTVQSRDAIKFITHDHRNCGLFTLSIEGILSLLVLGNFVGLVLLALFAVRPAGLWNVHLENTD